MSYSWADGYNNGGSTVVLDPQPKCEGVQREQVVAASGVTTIRGDAYLNLVWTALTATQFSALMSALGLSPSTPYNQGTIKYLQNDDRTIVTKNGIAHYPTRTRYFQGYWRDVVVRVTKLRDTT